jgi:hypothetical protein
VLTVFFYFLYAGFSQQAEPSPHKASNMCWARKPSLPHDVPLGKDLMRPRTVSTSATSGASGNKAVDMEGGGMYRCLSPINILNFFFSSYKLFQELLVFQIFSITAFGSYFAHFQIFQWLFLYMFIIL